MRILIAGQTYYPGTNGQAVFSIHLAEGLAANGNEVMVIVPNESFCSTHRTVHGVRIELRPAINTGAIHKDTLTSLPWDAGIGKLVDNFRPEVVHIQDFYPLARAVLRASRRRELPIIGTNHFLPGNLLCYFPRPLRGKTAYDLLWKVVLNAYNQFDLITAPSQTAAEILRRQAIQIEVHAVSNGVQLDRFKQDQQVDRPAIRYKYGLDVEKKIFLFVGRLEAEKRADLLVEALAILKREEAQVAIGGRGTQHDRLIQLIREKKLEGRARILGYIPYEDLPALLNSVDFFCMPSTQELQSLATLEAMACGLPVLAANAQALPELVYPGKNGYLFEPDNAESLAGCMAALLDCPPDWERMSRASMKIAEKHGLQKSIERYEELYAEVIERKKKIYG